MSGHKAWMDGPWKWHPSHMETDRLGSIYSEHNQGHAYAIAMQPRYVSNEEWAQYAPLIATAPDLLKALEDCIAQIKAIANKSDVPDSAYAALKLARSET